MIAKVALNMSKETICHGRNNWVVPPKKSPDRSFCSGRQAYAKLCTVPPPETKLPFERRTLYPVSAMGLSAFQCCSSQIKKPAGRKGLMSLLREEFHYKQILDVSPHICERRGLSFFISFYYLKDPTRGCYIRGGCREIIQKMLTMHV